MMHAAPRELPPLASAIRRLRQSCGESQERFAQRVGIAMMTLSRYERGLKRPRARWVLDALARVALGRPGLEDVERILAEAVETASCRGRMPEPLGPTAAHAWTAVEGRLSTCRRCGRFRLETLSSRFDLVRQASAPALCPSYPYPEAE